MNNPSEQTLFNSFYNSIFDLISINSKNNYEKNILYSRRKKKPFFIEINKNINQNLKIYILLIKTIIATFGLIYFFFNLKNVNVPINNKNISMKHAILLLSSYGIDYLNNFLSQFNNDKRFEIYIHIDKKSKTDIDANKQILKSNIKYCKHIYKSERYSLKMVDAMYKLLSKAYKSYKYDYYHFFSESCYLVKSLDEFYNFFVENNLNSYVRHYPHKYFLYHHKTNTFYKGSQWMSLHSDIVNKLLNYKYLFNKYKYEIENRNLKMWHGAYDEFIIQHIIIHYICKGKPGNYNVKNNSLRFIRWMSCSEEFCPSLLNINKVSEDEINYIKKNFLIIRKIDYKDSKAIELVNKLKGLS